MPWRACSTSPLITLLRRYVSPRNNSNLCLSLCFAFWISNHFFFLPCGLAENFSPLFSCYRKNDFKNAVSTLSAASIFFCHSSESSGGGPSTPSKGGPGIFSFRDAEVKDALYIEQSIKEHAIYTRMEFWEQVSQF